MNQSKLITTGVIIFLVLIVVLTFSNATFLTIDAGERGVLFKRFSGGLDKENIYQPGFHVIAPWNSMYVYDVREKQIEEEMELLSSNGLTISVDITVRVNPDFKEIPELHETFGKDYLTSLVRPEVRSSVRKVIGRFTPEELYSTRREEVQEMIQMDLEEALEKNYVDLRASLIRDITLPDKVRSAIEEKLEAEQSALKYEFISSICLISSCSFSRSSSSSSAASAAGFFSSSVLMLRANVVVFVVPVRWYAGGCG